MSLVEIVFLVTGLLLPLVSLPLVRRKVAPNHWYGFRVRATLEDEVIWYEVNAAAGKDLLMGGIAFLGFVLVGARSLSPPAFALWGSLFLVVASVIPAARGYSLAKQLWAERHPEEK